MVVTIMLSACAGGAAGPASTPQGTTTAGPTPLATQIPSPAPTQSPVPAVATPIPAPTDTASPAVPATALAPTPGAPAAAAPASDAVLIAAGDIASCLSSGGEATAQLVAATLAPAASAGVSGTVATLGDNVYERSSGEEFATCFTPSWGAFKDRIRPAPGNHEYLTPGAQGYFDYFGAAAGTLGQGYYSYDLGAWHIVALNSQCWDVGGCGAASPQSQWLKADLAAHPAPCTLAYWHVPRFSSGFHGDSTLVQAFWDELYAAGADVVLNGHDHDYERFAPQDPQGKADPARGIREFVVGTGGRSHYPFPAGPHPNTEARNASTYGVLKLTLHSSGYDWEFVPVAGQTFTDSGSGTCH